ncbi:MAG TPA: LysM peptidoglycan-binding domain-containing protein [Acidimicrobiales bacterium]|nr:LysM peptidoglycan-binding domain-containing protein [Acidimicrobiales bacterium]
MAAVEIEETEWVLEPREASLLLVGERDQVRVVRTLSQRRRARARMIRRRRRTFAGIALALSIGVLALPGTSFGGVTDTGLPTDLATSGLLAPGTTYVVQPGDTLSSIAQQINPLDAARARAALVAEVGSSVVVAGEHVLIP